MNSKTRSLFELVVDEKDAHPSFQGLRTQRGSEPTRWMMENVFQVFQDPDGNFVQQLQSTAFDSRFFELYLFAYLYYSGFDIDRTRPNPDFIVSRGGITAAIEATTVNPSTAGVLAQLGKTINELSGAEILEYQRHELPLRFGSPLFSKLQKRYWELPHARDLPFVLAIEAFHDEDSLGFGDSALTSYLYGISHSAQWDVAGKLSVDFDRIYSHVIGEKEVPSSFFDQTDAENVSAVIFTNSGTSAKFTRMGYQCGIGWQTIDIVRMGYCLNVDPDARDPTFFSYNLDDPPLVETWGQGLVVLHNPRSLRPLPLTFFPDAIQTVFEDGKPKTFARGWHPFTSKTLIVDMGEAKKKLAELLPRRMPRVAIGAITKDEFRGLAALPEPPVVVEDGWFADESNAFLGAVLHDPLAEDWGLVVMARDQFFQFRAIETESSLSSRNVATEMLQQRIAKRLAIPQRIFPQSFQAREADERDT